jgi:hypothetical protein
MKKNFLLVGIVLILLLCTNGIQAQTTQSKLDPNEVWKPFIGAWQTNVGKDTMEVWDYKLYGKALTVNVYQVTKDKKTPISINNVFFDSKEGKFKGFVLWNNGGHSTWISTYNAEKNSLLVDMVWNFNPETVWAKFEQVLVNPEEWTWVRFNKDGVKQWENKFTKVK